MDQYIEFVTNHYLLSFSLVCVIFLLIQDLLSNSFNGYESISPLIAVTKMNDDKTVIIDVREANEFLKSHIENAVNIPLGKLDEKLPSLEKHKTHPLIVICQTGARSVPACKTLTKAGFGQVYHMQGGMQSWEENKLPIKISKTRD
ncbi:rhodanese-like domain-containing protein [Methylomonas methanica]|uniref:Rhodanese-like protein n=1 Tax=Methylomonas methanica (strain DSM 25384 / MC09) TaxID=857087 RepID=F9ZZR2_METMM|nr:rhodanese-like domain-containing protein [Methylomonas methanica]AEF98721.1 Rhodanese-like protein [Methylomonas methanica MC09]